MRSLSQINCVVLNVASISRSTGLIFGQVPRNRRDYQPDQCWTAREGRRPPSARTAPRAGDDVVLLAVASRTWSRSGPALAEAGLSVNVIAACWSTVICRAFRGSFRASAKISCGNARPTALPADILRHRHRISDMATTADRALACRKPTRAALTTSRLDLPALDRLSGAQHLGLADIARQEQQIEFGSFAQGPARPARPPGHQARTVSPASTSVPRMGVFPLSIFTTSCPVSASRLIRGAGDRSYDVTALQHTSSLSDEDDLGDQCWRVIRHDVETRRRCRIGTLMSAFWPRGRRPSQCRCRAVGHQFARCTRKYSPGGGDHRQRSNTVVHELVVQIFSLSAPWLTARDAGAASRTQDQIISGGTLPIESTGRSTSK